MQLIFLGRLRVAMREMSLFIFQLWQLEDLTEHQVILPTFFQKQSKHPLVTESLHLVQGQEAQ